MIGQPRRRGLLAPKRSRFVSARPALNRRRLVPLLRRPRPRTVIVLAMFVAVLAGAWVWVRDSSLVAVERVSVSGQSGPDAGLIRSALIASARSMTTLDVSMSELRMAVAPFPVVKDLRVSTQFPHGMRIRVIEQVPVAAVLVDGRRIAVAGDGTLLHDVIATASLPSLPLGVAPGGTHLSGRALSEVHLLAAAPYQLLSRVTEVTTVALHGLVAQLRDGPSIYFGAPTQLTAKWTAASVVLADSRSAGALYVDVTDPQRAAAGAGTDGAAAAAAAAGNSGTGTAAGSSSAPPGGV